MKEPKLNRRQRRQRSQEEKDGFKRSFKMSVGIAVTLLQKGFTPNEAYQVLRTKYYLPQELAPDVMAAAQKKYEEQDPHPWYYDDVEIDQDVFGDKPVIQPRILRLAALAGSITIILILIILAIWT